MFDGALFAILGPKRPKKRTRCRYQLISREAINQAAKYDEHKMALYQIT